MRLQVPSIVMSLEEEEMVAMENRSKLRLIKSKANLDNPNTTAPTVTSARTDMEKAFEWLTNEFRAKYSHYVSERSIFGTVTIGVPVSECNPQLIVAILNANGVTLLEWKNVYQITGIPGINEKRILISVNLTFDTPEIGVLNMPI